MWLIFSICFLVMSFTGCDAAPTSVGSEPYSIRVNNALGVRLGMPYDEFAATHFPKSTKHARQADASTCASNVDEDFCPIPIAYDQQPNIGDVRVVFYTLTFYQKHLISINYSLAAVDWQSLVDGLNDKFGKSRKSGSGGLEWENSVSEVLFTKDESDFTLAHLRLSLSKETHDWLQKNRERQTQATKKSL